MMTMTTISMSAVVSRMAVVKPPVVRGRRVVRLTRTRATGEEGGAAGVKYVLRNCGDMSMAHLDAPVPPPGDLEISAAKSVIGRQKSDAVNLPIGVPTVSGAHAMIDLVDGKVMVTDLTSTNGTFIDGEELLPGVPTQLLVGGEVIFGDEFLARFELVELNDAD